MMATMMLPKPAPPSRRNGHREDPARGLGEEGPHVAAEAGAAEPPERPLGGVGLPHPHGADHPPRRELVPLDQIPSGRHGSPATRPTRVRSGRGPAPGPR